MITKAAIRIKRDCMGCLGAKVAMSMSGNPKTIAGKF